jgi:RNA polymerase sigma-70 factor (ECF subfamily)
MRPGITQTALADLTEEVLSRTAETALTKSFDTTRGSSVPAWLYGIARLVVRKETVDQGHAARHVGLEDAARAPDPARPPDDEFLARCEAERVREALSQLDPEDRDVLQLHYFEGRTASEIGARLSLVPGTVRVRLHRARNAVRKLLDPLWGEANP